MGDEGCGQVSSKLCVWFWKRMQIPLFWDDPPVGIVSPFVKVAFRETFPYEGKSASCFPWLLQESLLQTTPPLRTCTAQEQKSS